MATRRASTASGEIVRPRRSRPLIGITCDFMPARDGHVKLTVYERYATAVAAAGGMPVFLPPDDGRAEEQVALVDGIVLPGGDDLDPALWGGHRGPTFEPSDPRRTQYEMALVLVALERDLPVLGVCLGAQLLNVACGGSLRTDLPVGDLVHLDDVHHLGLRHDVDVMKDSLLARALGMPDGGSVSVSSAHKNAPDGLGEHLRASAFALDGIIEAIEHRERSFVLGVQWHVEHAPEGDPAGARLLRAFVEAAARRAGLR